MSASDPQPSLFAQALAIPAWLEADGATPYDERLHRERRIAADIDARDPLTRVLRWWERAAATRPVPAADTTLIARLLRARRLISLLMVLLGGAAGAAAALAVFHYDGTWPVNVVTVLASLVLLQIALIVLTLVLMLPQIPGVRAVQDLLGGLNPGALAAAAYRRLRRVDDSRADVLVWHEARGPAASRFARWQMLVWSQTAAVAFNAAVVLTAIALIAFTDLAFGWSTTLRLNADRVHRITQTLSLPWREFWPAAVPGVDLIEASRFYRLASAPPSRTVASELTGWWPFLLACILTYGLLPRVLMLTFASQRLRTATRHLLLDDPRTRALLDRMDTAEIQLGATDTENAPGTRNELAAAPPASDADALAIVWSHALPDESVPRWSLQHLQRRVSSTYAAGAATLDADRALLRQIASLQPRATLIFVRAWEAPLLDLQDFLADLRTAVGRECSIIVVPVSADQSPPTRAQQSTWSRWTARLADPALYMEIGLESGA
ncbi:MAG TPA: DUF2868 domain-containing protein [Povalibacter sp.]|uniref:DUF2868 domain-containing protein n=1 Tax=Povalibacter sp. TaxID=1962978 RepID=UPI002C24471F|nr:DUF2868 domain-containing protein [Povalibacter sp.]HMN43649.1 DUF2868 domain-containing protein [Povalibacter sp.]